MVFSTARHTVAIQGIEVAELEYPWHIREMLGELRDVAAVNNDQIGRQFVKFFLIAACSLASLKAATESGSPTSSAFSARSLIVDASIGTAAMLFA